MYAQSYQDEVGRIIPDTYSGMALRDNLSVENENDNEISEVPTSKNPWENESECRDEKKSGGGLLGDIFTSIATPFGIGKGGHGFKIGTEELLIIGVAAFLLFSKERDIECIIMLLALLLIT